MAKFYRKWLKPGQLWSKTNFSMPHSLPRLQLGTASKYHKGIYVFRRNNSTLVYIRIMLIKSLQQNWSRKKPHLLGMRRPCNLVISLSEAWGSAFFMEISYTYIHRYNTFGWTNLSSPWMHKNNYPSTDLPGSKDRAMECQQSHAYLLNAINLTILWEFNLSSFIHSIRLIQECSASEYTKKAFYPKKSWHVFEPLTFRPAASDWTTGPQPSTNHKH